MEPSSQWSSDYMQFDIECSPAFVSWTNDFRWYGGYAELVLYPDDNSVWDRLKGAVHIGRPVDNSQYIRVKLDYNDPDFGEMLDVLRRMLMKHQEEKAKKQIERERQEYYRLKQKFGDADC